MAITAGELDTTATTTLRATPHAAMPFQSFGPERLAHEAVWTEATYTLMGTAMAAIPLHRRAFPKKALWEALGTAPLPDPVAWIEAVLAKLASRHRPLAPACA